MTKSHKKHSKNKVSHDHAHKADHAHKTEHAHSHEHVTHKAKPAEKKNDNILIWQVATAIFAILFVISLTNGGFGISNNEVSQSDAQKDIIQIKKDVVNLQDDITEQSDVVNQVSAKVDPSLSNEIEKLLSLISSMENKLSDINKDIQKAEKKLEEKTPTKKEPVQKIDGALDVELYVMSQCPYGVQAEDTMFQAINEIGLENFNLNVDYIATDLGGGNFQSLHGEAEAQGNIVQLCVNEYEGQQAYLDVVLCMNKNSGAIPGNWKTCASDLGLDTNAIDTCFQGDEGKELLSASILKAQARQASGSPTIYVDNSQYSGGREVLDFKRAFCGVLGDVEGCSDVPEAVKFDVIVLSDSQCGSACDVSGIIGPTQSYFPGATIRYVDVKDSEGKDLVEKHGVEMVPVIIFDKGVEDTEMWKNVQFQGNFDSLGDGVYKLKDEVTQPTFYLDEEKQKEALAKMGVTLGDNKPQIDFFVMSYCPYGNQAEEGIVGAYDELKDLAEFKPHYIYYENYQGGGPNFCLDDESVYCSMHGAAEARQNIREQCVEEKYGIEAWFDFAIAMNAKCTSQNADTCYVDVAKDLGYDLDFISECEDTRAIEFAAKDLELSRLYGASGSPSVYIDGIAYSGSRDSSGYIAGLCAAFSDAPELCDNVVVQAPAPSAAPQAQC